MEQSKFKLPNCWVCMDKGDIVYKKINKITGVEYEYIASCVCKESADKQSFPPAKQFFDLVEIANRNLNKIYHIYKNNPEIKQQLDDFIEKTKAKNNITK